MPAIPALERENALLEMLTNSTTEFIEGNQDELLARVGEDWLESFSDNTDVNTAILDADAEPLEQDLLFENHMLTVFIKVLEGEPGTGSPLSERLRERWQDLFNREIERNQEIIDATK